MSIPEEIITNKVISELKEHKQIVLWVVGIILFALFAIFCGVVVSNPTGHHFILFSH